MANSVRYFYVGYACCEVCIVYYGSQDGDLPPCWICDKTTGEVMIPMAAGVDHPTYSVVKLAPSGRLD